MGWEASLEKWLRYNLVQQDRGEKGRHVIKESPVAQSTQRCGREDRLEVCPQRP